jgi:N-acetylneuraminic acid mutarotase
VGYLEVWEVTMKRDAVHSIRHWIAASCFLLASLSLASLARPQSGAPRGSWTTKAPLPTKRFEVGSVTLGNKMYVIAGESNGELATTLLTEYDPATDHWRELASIPHVTSHPGVASGNGKIYVLGGFTGVPHTGAMNIAYEYDVVTDKWRALPPLSSPRASVGTAFVDGKLHAISGRGLDQVTVKTHEVYDPPTGKWSKAAPLPTARDHAGVIAVDGEIHVIGGRTAGYTDLVNLHDVYDPKTDTWKSAAPIPSARSGGAIAYYHGLILYVGGECRHPKSGGGGEGFTENEAFDPKTDKWITLAPLPEVRNGLGGGAVGANAYFAGGAIGCGGAPTSDTLFQFTLP